MILLRSLLRSAIVKNHNVHLLLTKSLRLHLVQLKGATLAKLLSYIEDR